MTNPLQQLLGNQEIILLDGATGTYLFDQGLSDGAPPEEWNYSRPETIKGMHQAYIEAGSRLILTNSFGGTSYRLKLHNLQDRVVELNRLAAEHARAAADDAPHLVVVAGSLGPSGELLQPMGEMSYEAAVDAFAEQATGLEAGGVDLFWVETMSDLNEAKAAVEGARRVSDKPLCVTLSFDTKGRTMMGVTPQQAFETMSSWNLLAFGANCGNGVDEIEAVVHAMRQIDPNQPLIAKANAGIPEWIDNQLQYNGTPEVMGMYAQRLRKLGARLIGGCCGNTPAHIAAMARALQQPVLAEEIVAQGRQFSTNGQAKRRTRRRRRG